MTKQTRDLLLLHSTAYFVNNKTARAATAADERQDQIPGVMRVWRVWRVVCGHASVVVDVVGIFGSRPESRTYSTIANMGLGSKLSMAV